jgi:hypothetical protein
MQRRRTGEIPQLKANCRQNHRKHNRPDVIPPRYACRRHKYQGQSYRQNKNKKREPPREQGADKDAAQEDADNGEDHHLVSSIPPQAGVLGHIVNSDRRRVVLVNKCADVLRAVMDATDGSASGWSISWTFNRYSLAISLNLLATAKSQHW